MKSKSTKFRRRCTKLQNFTISLFFYSLSFFHFSFIHLFSFPPSPLLLSQIPSPLSKAKTAPLRFLGAIVVAPRCLNLLPPTLPSTARRRLLHMESSNNYESRGSLIVFEGLDRSGKTSQSARLVSFLKERGMAVEPWRFPDRTTGIGQMISAYLADVAQLDDRAVHLLFSANRWEKRVLMESKLRSGTSLIVDRYSFSGVAFSSAKGLDIEWCKAPEVGLIAPDLVLFLAVPPEKAAERGGYGTERYEKLEFQRKVAHYYNMLSDPTWEVIDGCLPVEAIQEKLRGLALDSIDTCQKGKPLTNLWPSE